MGAKHCGSWSVFTVERYVLRWGGMGLLLGWAAWWKHTPYRQERLSICHRQNISTVQLISFCDHSFGYREKGEHQQSQSTWAQHFSLPLSQAWLPPSLPGIKLRPSQLLRWGVTQEVWGCVQSCFFCSSLCSFILSCCTSYCFSFPAVWFSFVFSVTLCFFSFPATLFFSAFPLMCTAWGPQSVPGVPVPARGPLRAADPRGCPCCSVGRLWVTVPRGTVGCLQYRCEHLAVHRALWSLFLSTVEWKFLVCF